MKELIRRAICFNVTKSYAFSRGNTIVLSNFGIRREIHLDWLGIIKQTLFSTALTSGIVLFVLKFFADKHLSRRAETLKHELSVEAEKIKFDYQRMIQDFNHYTSKRHEIYPELYGKIIKTYDDSLKWYVIDYSRLFTDRKIITCKFFLERYTEKSKEEIELFLERLEILEEHEKLLEIKNEVYIFNSQLVKKSFDEAQNYFLNQELYLSEEVISLCKNIFLKLKHIGFMATISRSDAKIINVQKDLHNWANLRGADIKNAFVEFEGALEDLPKEVHKLKLQLKKELSVGDYT
ncbi:hypothetical protein D1872_164620 [compost metagenome]